jgi:hypothetical protein
MLLGVFAMMFVMMILVLSQRLSSYLYSNLTIACIMEAFFTIRITGANVQLTGLSLPEKPSKSLLSARDRPSYV